MNRAYVRMRETEVAPKHADRRIPSHRVLECMRTNARTVYAAEPRSILIMSLPEEQAPISPLAPSADASRPSTYDAELEAEIQAALGGLSVKDIEASHSSRAPQRATQSGGRQRKMGRIIQVRSGEVFVEFGPKSQGVCPETQFTSQAREVPAIGSEFEFIVERFDPFEGMHVLSIDGAVLKADWGTLEVGQIVDARCTGMNRGGLEMEIAHHKGFMPAGQVDVRHIPDISIFIGEKFAVKVVELNKDKDRLVVSRKAVLASERAEQREQLLAVLEVGQTRTATIVKIEGFGAFADLGGIDGLIHVSDLSHDRVKNPMDVVKVGMEVTVKILRIDLSGDRPKLSLGLKQLSAEPVNPMATIEVGGTVTGRVTKLMEFGAFVELAPGIEGLVHISEISHDRIPSPDAVLRRDEIITCKVLSIDNERRRISLSIKALTDAPARPAPAPRESAGGASSGGPRGGGGGGARRDSRSSTPEVARVEDPEVRKLRARFGGGDLKGGLS
ncbi:MAG: S1 RNA-binding domain-containing protein [Phycisphaerales bacterium]|nr:S1 RNA-binding domain-containing protein [Phycisphaerales bacterium]